MKAINEKSSLITLKAIESTCLWRSQRGGVPCHVGPGEDFLVGVLTRRISAAEEILDIKKRLFSNHLIFIQRDICFWKSRWVTGKIWVVFDVKTDSWQPETAAGNLCHRVKYLVYGGAGQMVGWDQRSPVVKSNAQNGLAHLQRPAKPILDKGS